MSASLSRAENLIQAMEQLAALFREETLLARKRDATALRRLSESKHILVRAYDEAARTLRLDIEGFTAIDTDIKDRLRHIASDFRQAVEENAATLRANMQATQSIVNTMVSTINKERAGEAGYVSRGGMALPAGYRRNGAPSTTLNRCL